jgi:hypothetical protein
VFDGEKRAYSVGTYQIRIISKIRGEEVMIFLK